MYIKYEYVNDVFEKAQKKFKNSGITINPNVMKRFEEAISEIASNSLYKAGTDIEDSHFTKITNEATLVIGEVVASGKKTENPVDMLMTLTDYLYAMTMKKLGSPNMPVSFGSEMKKHIIQSATTIEGKQSLNSTYQYSYNVYEKQRGKDAVEVRDKISDSLAASANGNPTPSQVQELVAAYKALSKRQSDHGFFWRIFHSTENNNRTQLLSEMQSALKYVLGNDIDIMECTSFYLAEKVLKQNVETQVNAVFNTDSMSERIGVSTEVFEDSSIIERDISEELRNKLTKTFETFENKEVQEFKTETIEVSKTAQTK